MELSKAILNTLTYFDLFDYPLTSTEAWKFLFLLHSLDNRAKGGGWPNGSSVSFNQVAEELELLRQQNKIALIRGFYCLAGRGQIVAIREERYRLSIPKMRIARREAKRLMLIPGVQAVAVSNSLSFRNSRLGGDIDFFVITKNNAVWRTRGLAAGYAAILDKRPRLGVKENKLCLCLFANEQSLDLEKYSISSLNNVPDVVRIYWTATLKLLTGDIKIWKKFCGANEWVNKFLPNWSSCAKATYGRQKKYSVGAPSVLEKILSKIQIKLLPETLKQKIDQDNEVVTSFGVIKLHQNNGRDEINKLFSTKCLS